MEHEASAATGQSAEKVFTRCLFKTYWIPCELESSAYPLRLYLYLAGITAGANIAAAGWKFTKMVEWIRLQQSVNGIPAADVELFCPCAV